MPDVRALRWSAVFVLVMALVAMGIAGAYARRDAREAELPLASAAFDDALVDLACARSGTEEAFPVPADVTEALAARDRAMPRCPASRRTVVSRVFEGESRAAAVADRVADARTAQRRLVAAEDSSAGLAGLVLAGAEALGDRLVPDVAGERLTVGWPAAAALFALGGLAYWALERLVRRRARAAALRREDEAAIRPSLARPTRQEITLRPSAMLVEEAGTDHSTSAKHHRDVLTMPATPPSSPSSENVATPPPAGDGRERTAPEDRAPREGGPPAARTTAATPEPVQSPLAGAVIPVVPEVRSRDEERADRGDQDAEVSALAVAAARDAFGHRALVATLPLPDPRAVALPLPGDVVEHRDDFPEGVRMSRPALEPVRTLRTDVHLPSAHLAAWEQGGRAVVAAEVASGVRRIAAAERALLLSRLAPSRSAGVVRADDVAGLVERVRSATSELRALGVGVEVGLVVGAGVLGEDAHAGLVERLGAGAAPLGPIVDMEGLEGLLVVARSDGDPALLAGELTCVRHAARAQAVTYQLSLSVAVRVLLYRARLIPVASAAPPIVGLTSSRPASSGSAAPVAPVGGAAGQAAGESRAG